MKKRVSVMLDDGVIRKIRTIQAKNIKNSKKSVSFSKVLNSLLDEELKRKT